MEKVKIKELKRAEYNPRVMYSEEMEQLEESIKKFGLVEPIVVNKDMTVIGGHQRLQACENLGMEEVDCTFVDLNKRQEKILNLALNKISGTWDETKLAEIIFDLKYEAVGFSDEEVEQYITRQEIMSDDEGYDPDDDAELKKLFERSEKVEVRVADPDEQKRKDRIAFYVENWEEYELIRENFKTGRAGELDKDKLIDILKNG